MLRSYSMKSRISRFLKLLCSILFVLYFQFSFSQTGQVPDLTTSIDGYFDVLYDNEGNQLTFEDIRIDQSLATSGSSGTLCTSTGFFVLHFDEGSGFEEIDGTDVDQLRRDVACAVFSDLSDFIVPADPETEVHIWFRDITDSDYDCGTLGNATSYYYMPLQSLAPQAEGFLDNTVWQTINSGVDAYQNVVNPIIATESEGEDGVFYHGQVSFRFDPVIDEFGVEECPAPEFHYNLDGSESISGTAFDFYTVLLHEMIHSLGFGTLINSSGGSLLGNEYFSRYDRFIQDIQTGDDVIYRSSNCPMTNFPGSNFGFISPYVSSLTGGIDCNAGLQLNGVFNNLELYTPDPFNVGSSINHFNDGCFYSDDDPEFDLSEYTVMSPQLYTGTFKRSLTDEDREALCTIGYRTNNTYGNVAHSNEVTYSPNWCDSRPILAGVGDGITDGTYDNTGIPGVPIEISSFSSSILTNDYCSETTTLNPSRFECLEAIIGSGTLSSNNGTETTLVTYTPDEDSWGLNLLRYIPVYEDENDNLYYGNITYVFVWVGVPCIPEPCPYNQISNGDFEEAIPTCGNLANFESNPMVAPCWNIYSVTPDIYGTTESGCDVNTYTIPNLTNGSIDPYNGLDSDNEHFLHMNFAVTSAGLIFEEAPQTQLLSPLLPGETYWVEMYINIYQISSTPIPSFPMTFAGSPSVDLIPVNPNFEVIGDIELLETEWVPFDGTSSDLGDTPWQYISVPFTVPSGDPLNTFIIVPDGSLLPTDDLDAPFNIRVYIDDVRIVHEDYYSPPIEPQIILPSEPLCIDQVWELFALDQYGEEIECGSFWSFPEGLIFENEITGTYYIDPDIDDFDDGLYEIYFQCDSDNDCIPNIVDMELFGIEIMECCDPSPEQVVTVIDNISCGELCFGSISIDDYDETITDLIYWTGPDGFVSDQSLITGLCEGDYDLIIGYNDGCSFEATYTVNTASSGSVSLTPLDADCNECNGAISFSTSGILTEYIQGFDLFISGETEPFYESEVLPESYGGLCPNNYTAVVTYNDGCTAQNVVTVGENTDDLCCVVGEVEYPLGYQFNTSETHPFSNEDSYLGEDLIISGSGPVLIENANLRFEEGASFIVNPNVELQLVNCNLYSCTTWEGIDLDANQGVSPAGLLMSNTCSIQYAYNAIENINYSTDFNVLDQLSLRLNDVHFLNNRHAIVLKNAKDYLYLIDDDIDAIIDCNFTLNDDYFFDHFDPNVITDYPKVQVLYDHTIGFSFKLCDFTNVMQSYVDGWGKRGIAIRTFNALFNYGGQPEISSLGIPQEYAHIDGFQYGIYSAVTLGTYNGMRIHDGFFEKNRVAIVNSGVCY